MNAKGLARKAGLFVLFRNIESFAFKSGEIKQKIACEAGCFCILTFG
jgi:hypothetical protein